MTTEEKISIMRILSDLMKADDIIDKREIDMLNDFRQEYNISDSQVAEAMKIPFSTAVQRLSGFSDKECVEFLRDVEKLSLADGKCCPAEAITLLSVMYSLDPALREKTLIGHTSVVADHIKPHTVVYVESEYNAVINNIIAQNYRAINDAFNLAGFDFIYVPHCTDKYKSLEAEYIKNVITYIAPFVTVEGRDSIYSKLCGTTTSEFCKALLTNKLSLNMVSDTKPALLIKIGQSIVNVNAVEVDADKVNNQSIFPEYLKIDISEDNTLADIYAFIDSYNAIVSERVQLMNKTYATSEGIFYGGFYKSFINLLAFPGKKVESKIYIDIYKRRIELVDLGETVALNARERAIYAFILFASVNKINIDRNETKSSERKKLDSIFAKIYEWIGQDSSNAVFFNSSIDTSISRIRHSINKVKLLENKGAYLPQLRSSNLNVGIDADKVFVINIEGKAEPIISSSRWNKLIKKQ